jgi:DNA-binding HxlR family transcriptional regulator
MSVSTPKASRPAAPTKTAAARTASSAPVEAPKVPGPARKLSQKVRRGELLAAACPSRDVLKHVTSRWGVLVLMVLESGPHRFAELRRAIGGVSERMLAQTLQWLEGDGLVDRRVFDVVPPHVEYRLTPLGQHGASRVRELADWIEENLHEVLDFRANRASEVRATKRATPGVRAHRLI